MECTNCHACNCRLTAESIALGWSSVRHLDGGCPVYGAIYGCCSVDKAVTQAAYLAPGRPAARWRSLFVVEALSGRAMDVSHGPVRAPPHRDRDPALRPAAGVRLPLPRPGHRPPVGGAKPQRAAANGNRADGSRSPGLE